MLKKEKKLQRAIVRFGTAYEFCAKTRFMEYKKHERNMPHCLECGDRIRYGRSDKKFCCDDCKTKYHNDQARKGRAYRLKVDGPIRKNYEILDEIIHEGRASADLGELMLKGFSPGMGTSFRRCGKHDVYGCYDIKYIMSTTRLFSIMKIENL